MFTFKPFLFALQLQEPDGCTQVQCAWARGCRLPAFHPPCTRHRQAESKIMLNPVRMRSVVFTSEVCDSKCVCMCMQVHAHACPTKQTHSDVPDTFCKSCTQKIQCRPWRAVWVVATMLRLSESAAYQCAARNTLAYPPVCTCYHSCYHSYGSRSYATYTVALADVALVS